jgi:hypothetical protein
LACSTFRRQKQQEPETGLTAAFCGFEYNLKRFPSLYTCPCTSVRMLAGSLICCKSTRQSFAINSTYPRRDFLRRSKRLPIVPGRSHLFPLNCKTMRQTTSGVARREVLQFCRLVLQQAL